jgi:hypothetical protein
MLVFAADQKVSEADQPEQARSKRQQHANLVRTDTNRQTDQNQDAEAEVPKAQKGHRLERPHDDHRSN